MSLETRYSNIKRDFYQSFIYKPYIIYDRELQKDYLLKYRLILLKIYEKVPEVKTELSSLCNIT